MAISEESRHHLYRRLQEVLGAEDTATLMSYLPPAAWADVTTKVALRSELGGLEERVNLRFDNVEFRLAAVEDGLKDLRGEIKALAGEFRAGFKELRAEFRTSLYAMMTMMVMLVGATLAAVKL